MNVPCRPAYSSPLQVCGTALVQFLWYSSSSCDIVSVNCTCSCAVVMPKAAAGVGRNSQPGRLRAWLSTYHILGWHSCLHDMLCSWLVQGLPLHCSCGWIIWASSLACGMGRIHLRWDLCSLRNSCNKPCTQPGQSLLHRHASPATTQVSPICSNGLAPTRSVPAALACIGSCCLWAGRAPAWCIPAVPGAANQPCQHAPAWL